MIMRSPPKSGHEPLVILKKDVRGSASGKTYNVVVTGFYDDEGVLNVEFHYGDIDHLDMLQMEQWQNAYVAALGRRVY